MESCTSNRALSQGKLNGAVLEFIIGGGLPFTLVKRDFFKTFVKTLRPERDVLAYQTLLKMMNEFIVSI